MPTDAPDSSAPSVEPKASGAMPILPLLNTPIQPGEIIGGRYRVERVIAEGGMGVIVAARHIELEETVAIKFLKEEFASQREIVGRFAREAKAAAKIRSEYTAVVHDVGISPERGPYIVMEYLEGEDLDKVLQSHGRLSYARATELVMQACEAISVAHANGIIHRDIKPANLFLVKNDHDVPFIKVLDFGVSKTALTGNVFGGAISLVKTQSLLGSPIYMSPEQLRGSQSEHEVGFPSDIWAIGAVLYELVTGTTAFTGSSITELCAAVLEREPQPISEHVPDVPAGVDATIMRCLQKDPRKRPQSVAELVCELAPYAPKRARMSVERVVAVSRKAGLVAETFAAPTTLTPPPPDSMSTFPRGSLAAPPPPSSLFETQPEAKLPTLDAGATQTTIPASEQRGGSRSIAFVVVCVLLLSSLAAAGALWFRGPRVVVREEHAATPPAAVAPVPTTTTGTTAEPPAEPAPPVRSAAPPARVIPPTPAALPSPPIARFAPLPRPIGAPPPRSAAPVKPPVAPASPTPEPAVKKADPLKSAIDDRK